MSNNTKRFIVIGLLLIAAGLILILSRCLTPPTQPAPTPSTPTLTPTMTATGTAVPTSTDTPTSTPTITRDMTNTPLAPTSTPIPGTAVPTLTPTPSATPYTVYTVHDPIQDTLWNRAAIHCLDANLWPNLASANGVKNPRHLHEGDIIIVRCE